MAVATVALCSSVNANITNSVFYSVNTNVLNGAWSYPSKGGTATVNLTGNQYGNNGLVNGTVSADGVTDPILFRGDDIFNDTTNAWSDYHVVVSLATNFTLSTVTIYNPGDWTDVLQPEILVGGQYSQELDFYMGTAIAPGDDLNFSYKLTFSGLTQYSVTETLTPSYVPEPGVMVLAMLGGLALGGLKLRKRAR